MMAQSPVSRAAPPVRSDDPLRIPDASAVTRPGFGVLAVSLAGAEVSTGAAAEKSGLSVMISPSVFDDLTPHPLPQGLVEI